MLYQPFGRKGPSPQRRKYTKKYHRIVPSSARASPTRWGNHCGPDDRGCHTQPRRTIVPKRVATPLVSGCVPGPDIATAWTCPTPVYTHTARPGTNNTHTARVIVLCALRRPTCPQSNAIERNQAGLQPQQRKDMGASPTYDEDTPDRRQVQRKKKKRYVSNEFCAKTDLCPLASPRVARVGVVCSGTPTMATRGEARGHP